MAKEYEVIVCYDPAYGQDVRCRSDIDTHPDFSRGDDGRIFYTDSMGNDNIYTVVYKGHGSHAKFFAKLLKHYYKGLRVPCL